MLQWPHMPETEIPKIYAPKDWEDRLYTAWDTSGFFNPDTCIKAGITDVSKPTFSIVLPPPNVTGTLHAGHAAMLAIEDAIVRYHRMRGDRTLWLPGTDHAAIATQSKVEKILWKQEHRTRYDLGRDAFLARVEQFAQESHDTIVNQCKKMGSSLDWSREAYTLDAKRSLAVRTAFKRMYDDGLIYRGHRIVNWDPKGQTTISDDEIVYQEEPTTLYYFQYGPFVISTARPETKFGDKYVVMHPDDERYTKWQHGQTFEAEWINGPITATVIKDASIDMSFGTGVMTITPWHSLVDFEMAERHNLDKEQIIDEQGKLLPIAAKFSGMDIAEARPLIVEKLRAKGLVVKEEAYVHNIATAERTGGIVEPQIKRQWFVAVNKEFERDGKTVTLKKLLQDAVTSGNVNILPERFSKTYFHWIDNLRDWCISRQIWFGHQVPVWYRGDDIFCGIDAPDGTGWEQDSDTLDTWFSSGLWTFSTLGWPDTETADFQAYHPTTLLETGYDILFFWVARMILMSEYFLGVHPFETVYLHGLVRDEQGRKMSKSLGNVIDPLTVSERYGADALRLALISGSTPGNDAKLSDEKIVAMRNFTNKLWNLARYVGTQPTPDNKMPVTSRLPHTGKQNIKTDADRWISEKLAAVTKSVTQHMDRYELSLATEELRDFTWGDFADWYVEVHKIEKNDVLLCSVFSTILRLWHPFMPFVTEAIHQTFRFDPSELLMIARWPTSDTVQAEADVPASQNRFELLKELVVAIRNTRASYRIEPAKKMSVSVFGPSEHLLRENEAIFQRLTRVDEIRTIPESVAPDNTIPVQAGSLRIFLHLDGVIDTDKEKRRLENELAEKTRYITSLQNRLDDPKFSSRAPEHILTQTKTLLDEALIAVDHLKESLARFER